MLILLSTNIFSQNAGEIIWRQNLNFPNRSCPAIDNNGIIYLGTTDQDHKLYAIDIVDVSIKWSFELNRNEIGIPAIGKNGEIYVGAVDGDFYCLFPNGVQKWRVTLPNGYLGCSPAVSKDGTIYVKDNIYLYALDGHTGKEKWKNNLGWPLGKSSPVIGDTGVIYFGSDNKNLYAVSKEGHTLWSFPTGLSIQTSPALGNNGIIYFSSDYLYAVDETGELKWRFRNGYGSHSSPSIGTNGIIYWTEENLDNRVILYAIKPNGSEKWNTQLGIRTIGSETTSYSSPIIGDNGIIYVTNQSTYNCDLFAVNAYHTIIWQLFPEREFRIRPDISHDITLSNNGILLLTYGDELLAVQSSSVTLASSPWPKVHYNMQNTRRHKHVIKMNQPQINITNPVIDEIVHESFILNWLEKDDHIYDSINLYYDNDTDFNNGGFQIIKENVSENANGSFEWNTSQLEEGGPYYILGIISNDEDQNYDYSAGTITIKHQRSIVAANPEKDKSILKDCFLCQNYPNPFNNCTTIRFILYAPIEINLKIFNIQGQLIRTLMEKLQEAGDYSITWDGRNETGVKMSCGFYIFSIETDQKILRKKMLLLK
jgi:outer membrane protein assembly factor BamB